LADRVQAEVEPNAPVNVRISLPHRNLAEQIPVRISGDEAYLKISVSRDGRRIESELSDQPPMYA
jgi:hypothetical protein